MKVLNGKIAENCSYYNHGGPTAFGLSPLVVIIANVLPVQVAIGTEKPQGFTHSSEVEVVNLVLRSHCDLKLGTTKTGDLREENEVQQKFQHK